MLKNAYLLAKIGADTAENEQHIAEILPIGRRVADRCPGPHRLLKRLWSGGAHPRAPRYRRSPYGLPPGGRTLLLLIWASPDLPEISNNFLQNKKN